MKEASSLFAIGITSRVEDDAVPGFERHSQGCDLDMVAGSECNQPNKSASFFPIARADKLLVVHAVDPSAVKPAREHHLQPVFVGRVRLANASGQRRINCV